MPRALISGTGLIGTSIALGLRTLGWATLGWDAHPEALAGAVNVGAVEPVASRTSSQLSPRAARSSALRSVTNATSRP